MTVLSIGVVGVGYRSHDHIRVLQALTDRYRLVGVADADATRRTEAGEQYRVPSFATAEELFDAVRPDVVLICIPPDGHHPVAVLAAERGIHVVTEVPVAPTLAMADVMTNAAERHGVKLAVAENVWRWPTEHLKRAVVGAGLLGDLTQVHLWYTSGSYHGISAVRAVMPSDPVRALGVARTVRTHPRTDLMGRTVTQQNWELGVIEFADGATCVYQQPIHPARGNHWEFVGTEGYLAPDALVLEQDKRRIPIEREMVEIDGQQRLAALRVAADEVVEWRNPLQHYAIASDDGIALGMLYTEFADAVEGDGTVSYDGNAGRKDQEILLALRESASHGSSWVDLPLPVATRFEQEFHRNYLARYGVDPFAQDAHLAASAYPRMGVSQYVTAAERP